ncbi:MAG: cysteine desulfurase [bacterium]
MSSYRSDFPIFATHPDLVYLDSAATAQKPEAVIKAVDAFYRKDYASVHRGLYPLAVSADQAYDAAHQTIADFIGAGSSKEIIFTRSATEGLNLLASSLGEDLGEGDEIILSVLEHHANLVPWQQLASHRNLKLTFVGLKDGYIDLSELEKFISPRTRIVSLSHCSNVLGRFLDAHAVRKMLDRQGSGIRFIVDASQSAPHISLNVQTLGCDFLVLSGHKLYGPSGIGVLWGREDLLEAIPPYQTGGDMISTVTLEGSTWNTLPSKFEAGTPNIEGAIGLAAAVTYLQEIGMANVTQEIAPLASQLRTDLETIEGVTILGNPDPESGLISFSVNGIHPHDIADLLGQKNICVRAGQHCAEPLHKELEIPATVRASLGIYNTAEDCKKFIAALREIIEDIKNA